MAKAKNQKPSVKGNIIVTPKGKSLFVSVPNASPYDALKQEASLTLTAADAQVLRDQLQTFLDGAEAKASGITDKGFVEALFKEDTDADGNATGSLRIKAKTAMQYPAKLYDASGAVFNPPVGFSLPNRADIKMSIRPELMETSMFTGIVLRLQAIKILSLPTFGGDDGMGGDESSDGSFAASVGVSSWDAPVADTTTGSTGWE